MSKCKSKPLTLTQQNIIKDLKYKPKNTSKPEKIIRRVELFYAKPLTAFQIIEKLFLVVCF
jgi:hypothetical protein